MELTSIIDLASTQGAVFWAGAVAVALGATLLVVAVAQQLGRIAATRLATRRGATTGTNTPGASGEADTYTPSMPPKPAVEAEEEAVAASIVEAVEDLPPADQSLALLLRRLQSAGDRLEEISRDIVVAVDTDETGLKEPVEDVEYVFKACSP
jgi:hypothetical protein